MALATHRLGDGGPTAVGPALQRDHPRGDEGEDWRAIRTVVEAIAADGGLIAVIVFGSLARLERSVASDVDLIVVVEQGCPPSEIRQRIRAAAAGSAVDGLVTPSFFTESTLSREARRRPSFAAHLLHEGVVIFETPAFGEIEAVLRAAGAADQGAIENELAERTAVLDQLTELERFNGEFVPALSQIYTLSRSVVIAKLLQEGVHEYSWLRIFDALSLRHPDLSADLDRLSALRPYYEHVHGRTSLRDADQRVDPADVEAAISSVRSVSGAGAGAGG